MAETKASLDPKPFIFPHLQAASRGVISDQNSLSDHLCSSLLGIPKQLGVREFMGMFSAAGFLHATSLLYWGDGYPYCFLVFLIIQKVPALFPLTLCYKAFSFSLSLQAEAERKKYLHSVNVSAHQQNKFPWLSVSNQREVMFSPCHLTDSPAWLSS